MRTGVDGGSDGVGQHLSGGVIHVDLELHEALPVGTGVGCGTDDHLQQVGTMIELRVAGAEPHGAHRHGRHRTPRGRQRCRQCRPGRGGQFDGYVDAVHGGIPQQFDGRRGGVGDDAVRSPHHTATRRHR